MNIRRVQPIHRYVATVSIAGLLAGAWIVARDVIASCNFVQGYYLSRPLRADEMTRG